MVWRTVWHVISLVINYISWVDTMLQWFYYLYSVKCYNSITSNNTCTERMYENGDVLIIHLGNLSVHRVGGSPSAWPMLTKNLLAEKGTEQAPHQLGGFLKCMIDMSVYGKELTEQEKKPHHCYTLKGLSCDKSRCGYYGREIFGRYLCHARGSWVILSTSSRKLHQVEKFARKNACNILLVCIFLFRQTSYFEINKVCFYAKD